jgi:ketosteroid isomerase-like protein
VPEAHAAITQEEFDLAMRGYELWNAGDFDRVAEVCFADDIEWSNAPDWPGTRTYRGVDEVIAFLRDEVAPVIELGDIEIGEVDIHGDELLIRMLARTRGAASELDAGKLPVYHVSRIRGGRVDRVRVYLDESEAVAAARGD